MSNSLFPTEQYGNIELILLSDVNGPIMGHRKFGDIDGNSGLIQRFGGQTTIWLPRTLNLTNEILGTTIDKYYDLTNVYGVEVLRGTDAHFAVMPSVKAVWSDLYITLHKKNNEAESDKIFKKSPELLFPDWYIPNKIIAEIYNKIK
jgi:hypothetical protein